MAGVGWIGLNRLEALAAAQSARIVCIADSRLGAAQSAAGSYSPSARIAGSFDELLRECLDGIVIATPSGLHAYQAEAALNRGVAVFCQKPLARTEAEAAHVIAVARAADRLLAVDFCYRTVAGVADLAALVQSGALGDIYFADLVFHNAYGPDKPWYYDLDQSGGGCVMDLGFHLVDLLLWVLGYPHVVEVRSRLRARGKLLSRPARELEDHALADIQFANGCTARLACSWHLAAGRDAVIQAAFYGTRASATLYNVDGSFYDFVVEHCIGTSRQTLARGPDAWGGRAVCAWVQKLARSPRFDFEAERLQTASSLIDAIYGRSCAF
ncbi:MAG TPA: Gfo/Idh/MocA family oxidoreductase [Steroidobacteraceae bacterium]